MPEGLELFFGVAIQDVGAEGGAVSESVAGHLGVGGDAEGVGHPAVEVFGAEALVSLVEVDALDLEGGEWFGVVDAVADDAGEAGLSGQDVAGFGEFGVAFGFVRSAGGDAMEAGEARGEFVGVVVEGGHAHVEPGAGAFFDGAVEHGLDVGGVEHLADVGEVGSGLVEFLVVSFDVGDEGFGFLMGGGEERLLAVAVVAGEAALGGELAFGELGGGVAVEGVEGLGGWNEEGKGVQIFPEGWI